MSNNQTQQTNPNVRAVTRLTHRLVSVALVERGSKKKNVNHDCVDSIEYKWPFLGRSENGSL